MPRRTYGGSYVARGSHNDTRLPTNKSTQTPKDLGVLDAGSTELKGVVGSQSGAATIFYQFRTERGLRIRLVPEELNSFTSPRIQWALRRVDGGSGEMREPLQLFTRNQDNSGEEGYLIDPGTFQVVVSTSSWYELPFRVALELREPPSMEAPLPLELAVEARLNHPDLAPQHGAAAKEDSIELDLEITARLIQTIDMPRSMYFGYATPDYWAEGYAVGDDLFVGSQLDVPGLELEIIASLSVVSPSTL